MSPRKIINIAVVDFDNCAVTEYLNSKENEWQYNPDPDGLSQVLITDILAKKCQGFYGCTGRITGLASEYSMVDDEFFDETHSYYGARFNPRRLLSTDVTRNLAAKLNLQCFAVSTPEDFALSSTENPLGICGSGYEQFMQPYETLFLELNAGQLKKLQHPTTYQWPLLTAEYKKMLFDAEGVLFDEDTNKNVQLMAIAKHARAANPDAEIILHFYDDELENYLPALKLTLLPPGVTLSVYECSAYHQTMNFLGSVSGPMLRSNSLFALKQDAAKSSPPDHQSPTNTR